MTFTLSLFSTSKSNEPLTSLIKEVTLRLSPGYTGLENLNVIVQSYQAAHLDYYRLIFP